MCARQLNNHRVTSSLLSAWFLRTASLLTLTVIFIEACPVLSSSLLLLIFIGTRLFYDKYFTTVSTHYPFCLVSAVCLPQFDAYPNTFTANAQLQSGNYDASGCRQLCVRTPGCLGLKYDRRALEEGEALSECSLHFQEDNLEALFPIEGIDLYILTTRCSLSMSILAITEVRLKRDRVALCLLLLYAVGELFTNIVANKFTAIIDHNVCFTFVYLKTLRMIPLQRKKWLPWKQKQPVGQNILFEIVV